MTWHDEVKDRIVTNFGEKEPFTIEDVYEWEQELKNIYPDNRHVRETFRDIMQDFRDDGWIRFKDFEGTYEIRHSPDGKSESRTVKGHGSPSTPEPERKAPPAGA